MCGDGLGDFDDRESQYSRPACSGRRLNRCRDAGKSRVSMEGAAAAASSRRLLLPSRARGRRHAAGGVGAAPGQVRVLGRQRPAASRRSANPTGNWPTRRQALLAERRPIACRPPAVAQPPWGSPRPPAGLRALLVLLRGPTTAQREARRSGPVHGWPARDRSLEARDLRLSTGIMTLMLGCPWCCIGSASNNQGGGGRMSALMEVQLRTKRILQVGPALRAKKDWRRFITVAGSCQWIA